MHDAIAAGHFPSSAALPSPAALDRLPTAERRALTRRLGASVSRARRGEYASAMARKEAGLWVRGRVGGELCRHVRAHEVCTRADCPFVHAVPAAFREVRDQSGVHLRLRIVVNGGGPSPAGRASLALCASISFDVGSDAGGAVAGGSAAARAEAARLRDVVGLSVRRAHIPNKVSNKMLNELLVPLANGHGPRQQTDEQPPQPPRERDRPACGIITIPTESAAAAAVCFDPTGKPPPPQQQARSTDSPSAGDVVSSKEAALRPGFESSSARSLHYDTVRWLAEALSAEPVRLHAWVSAESDRTHQLPDAFREIWARHERRGVQQQQQQQLEDHDGAGGGTTAATHGTHSTSPVEHDEGGLDAGTAQQLQARLRQRMRHAMNDTMQQANPESYYQDLEHQPERAAVHVCN